MNRIFVLGNGESRRNVDLQLLQTRGPIIGCNALYRDFIPDFLVVVDERMLAEARFEMKFQIPIIMNYHGWSAGPTAVDFAARMLERLMIDRAQIFLLGFDLYGTEAGYQNNIYKGTLNYEPQFAPATPHGNWVHQLSLVFATHPCYFFRVGRENDPMPDLWKMGNRIDFISYDKMEEICGFRQKILLGKPWSK